MKPYRTIRINGVLYETYLKEAEEVFLPNRIVKVLLDTGTVDINQIYKMTEIGCFSLDELVSFYAARGWGLEQLPDEIYERLEIEEVVPEMSLSSPMEAKVKELLVDYAKEGLLNIKKRNLSPSSRDNSTSMPPMALRLDCGGRMAPRRARSSSAWAWTSHVATWSSSAATCTSPANQRRPGSSCGRSMARRCSPSSSTT